MAGTLAPIQQTHPLLTIHKDTTNIGGSGIAQRQNVAPVAKTLTALPADIVNPILAALTNIDNTLGKNNVVNRGALTDLVPKPAQITYTVTNNSGSGALAITAYIFNEDVYNATPTNNGSGSASVTKAYSDGFGGSSLNNLIKTYGIEGLPFKELQMTSTDTSTGNQDKAALNDVQPRRLTFNGSLGGAVWHTDELPINTTGNPAYNQAGYLVMDIDFRVRPFEQIGCTVDVGTKLSVILIPA